MEDSKRWEEGIARISHGVFCRISARLLTLSAAISLVPEASASGSVCNVRPSGEPATGAANAPPLSPIARWKRPFASGDAIRNVVLLDPADWPKMVTLPGSPPKAAMFYLTHCRAVI